MFRYLAFQRNIAKTETFLTTLQGHKGYGPTELWTAYHRPLDCYVGVPCISVWKEKHHSARHSRITHIAIRVGGPWADRASSGSRGACNPHLQPPTNVVMIWCRLRNPNGKQLNKSQIIWTPYNRVRRQSGFPTFISCQRQDPNVLRKRRQSHQGDKLCDVSTVPLVARWPVFLARGSDADGETHSLCPVSVASCGVAWRGVRELILHVCFHNSVKLALMTAGKMECF